MSDVETLRAVMVHVGAAKPLAYCLADGVLEVWVGSELGHSPPGATTVRVETGYSKWVMRFDPPLAPANAAPASPAVRTPNNAQHEPPYPGAETVVTSIRYPEQVIHRATARCAKESPHHWADCGEASGASPAVREAAEIERLRAALGAIRDAYFTPLHSQVMYEIAGRALAAEGEPAKEEHPA